MFNILYSLDGEYFCGGNDTLQKIYADLVEERGLAPNSIHEIFCAECEMHKTSWYFHDGDEAMDRACERAYDTALIYQLPGAVYFSSREGVKKAIDHFGDRLDLLLESG